MIELPENFDSVFRYIVVVSQRAEQLINGAKPRDLDQNWLAPPKIAVNLRVAEIIGFDPPFDVLAAADEIYEEIEKAK